MEVIFIGNKREGELQGPVVAPTVPVAPLPTPPPPGSPPLLDIESGLEDLIPDALGAIREVFAVPDVPKVRVETARWLIDDRRKYRLALQAGDAPSSEEDVESLKNLILFGRAEPS